MDITQNIDSWDVQFIQFINSLHTDWMDTIMVFFSDKHYPIPLYAFLIFLLYKKYGLKNLIFVLTPAIVIMIIMADYTASGICKPYFERLRPSHEPFLNLHLPNGKGGQYGFFSSHASNTFATAFFLLLHLKDKHKWISLLILWAAVVSFSRVYLGVHYLTDVTVGAIFGSLVGLLLYKISIRYIETKQ